MTYDAVVIGGGVSGITAALVLAKYGQRVALIEKHHQVAPVVRGFSRAGHHFDTGFHYAGRCLDNDPLGMMLRFLGVQKELTIQLYDVKCFDRIKIENSSQYFDLPQGNEHLIDYLCTKFPHQRKGIEQYLNKVRQVCDHFDLLDLTLALNQKPSLHDVLTQYFDDSLLIQILSAHSLLYGSEPHETSFVFHAMVVGPYYQEAYTFVGGGRALINQLSAKLKQERIELFLGSEACMIEIDSDRHVTTVVLANGTILSTQCVVYSGHPKALQNLVPSASFRPAYYERLTTLKDTPSASVLYGVTRKPLECLQNSNVIVLPKQSCLCQASPDKTAPGIMYVTKGQKLNADAEGSSFFALFPAFSHAQAMTLNEMKVCMAQTFPQFEQDLVWMETASPATFARYNFASSGSLYGVKHIIGQTNPLPLTRLKGLLLAGQSVGAPGVIGAMSSALHTAAHIIGQEKVYGELTLCK